MSGKRSKESGGSGLGSFLALGAAALIGGAITYLATKSNEEERKETATANPIGHNENKIMEFQKMWGQGRILTKEEREQ